MRLVESNKVDNNIISNLLEDEQEGRYYDVSIGFGGYIGVEEKYNVYAKNRADAVGEALDNPGSEAEQDLSVDNIEDNGDGSYTCTVSFAGNIGADNEYTVYADSEEEAEMNAIDEAKSDLEVISVDGKEFSYDDDSNFNESVLTELDRSNIMSDQDVVDICNLYSSRKNHLKYKIVGNSAVYEDGTTIKFIVNGDSEIIYYFINSQGDASKKVPVYDWSLLDMLTESLNKNKLKEETDWSKQLSYEVIEAKAKEICNVLNKYFTEAGYNVLKVKYADDWMFEVQVYLSKPNFGEIDIYLDTRYSEFEFGHLKLVDKNTIDAEDIDGLNKLIQIANNINSSFNLLDIVK